MIASGGTHKFLKPDLVRWWARRLSFLLLMLIALSPRLAGAAGPDPFCLAIEEIIQSGQRKFKSITGKLDLVSEEYFGLVTPPELQDCFGWLNGKAYHCTSKAGMSEAEVAQAYTAFNTRVQGCLPGEWRTKERDMQRANAQRVITYTSTATPVKIRISERSKRHGWFVDFYFLR